MKKIKFNFLPNIDPRIYISFGVLFLLSLIFFIYQYFRHIDCENAKYIVHADEFLVNRVVEFYDNTEGATSWKWDFGDSTAIDNRQRTFHQYKKPGEYIVKLTINGTCTHEKLVTISSISQQVGYLPIIMAPDVAFVGDVVQFDAEKEGGESWEWSFGETIEGTGATDFFEWMTNSFERKEGSIKFLKRDSEATLKELKFTEAYLVKHKEKFDSTGDNPLTETFTISARKIEMGTGVFENEWV